VPAWSTRRASVCVPDSEVREEMLLDCARREEVGVGERLFGQNAEEPSIWFNHEALLSV
jgi:hypothetical protein